uniref:DRG2 n=1 Tax=Angiostrongylus cantonensis TaxID=6313 RepID=A0A0K0DGB0_ANGCA
MARTQKNKATNAHLGMLKARLAKLRQELITPKGGGGGSGEGFDVAKTGDARVGFVGTFIPCFKILSVFIQKLAIAFVDVPR